MWLKHFARKHRTKKYQAFKERYWEFRAGDTVVLCEGHHQAIHALYYKIIKQEMERMNYLPMKYWTWKDADRLMNKLRRACNDWLKKETKAL